MNPGIAAVSSPKLDPSGTLVPDPILAQGDPAGFAPFPSAPDPLPPAPDPLPPVPVELTATPSKELGDLWNMYRFWRKGMA